MTSASRVIKDCRCALAKMTQNDRSFGEENVAAAAAARDSLSFVNNKGKERVNNRIDCYHYQQNSVLCCLPIQRLSVEIVYSPTFTKDKPVCLYCFIVNKDNNKEEGVCVLEVEYSM